MTLYLFVIFILFILLYEFPLLHSYLFPSKLKDGSYDLGFLFGEICFFRILLRLHLLHFSSAIMDNGANVANSAFKKIKTSASHIAGITPMLYMYIVLWLFWFAKIKKWNKKIMFVWTKPKDKAVAVPNCGTLVLHRSSYNSRFLTISYKS